MISQEKPFSMNLVLRVTPNDGYHGRYTFRLMLEQIGVGPIANREVQTGDSIPAHAASALHEILRRIGGGQ